MVLTLAAVTVARTAGQSAQTPSPPASDTRPAFGDWLADVRKEALARGVRQDVVDVARADIEEPLPVVLERDRAQAEIVLPLETYVRRRLTPKFIKAGREAYSRHRLLLEEIGKAYGVSPAIITAMSATGAERIPWRSFGRRIGTSCP